MLALGAALGAIAVARPPAPPSPGVRLVVDYADGTQKVFKSLAWSKGMTVLDAMNLAKQGPRGLSFEFTGQGETGFLKRIDDLANEGAGKRNWVYWVNATLGDRSFAAKTLEPADVVQWEFASPKTLKEGNE